MKEVVMEDENRITPSSLLIQMGVTPADNREGIKTALPWKSMWGGVQTRTLFQYQKYLEEISRNYQLVGPLAIVASLQNTFFKAFLTDPIKAHARIAVRAGKEPDVYRDMNSWTYKNYTRSLYELCRYFMKDNKFDRDKARRISTTPEGHQMLKEYVQEFAQMEYNYNALGMTRLNAMKEMLKCLLVVITETPLDDETLPFMRRNADGTDGMTFEEYLAENRFRLECLYKANAFDPKEYSERTTRGRIGCSDYEIVRGSKIHSVRLRHYVLPKGIKPNGKVLYCSTPLINNPELFDLADEKSVVQGMLKEGYAIYLVDHGECDLDDTRLGLDFFGKTVHDRYLGIIKKKHPECEINVMGYCMGGTLMLPYLARRAEERMARGEKMDICKLALMASPAKFDDDESGHGPMRSFIRQNYDPYLMDELFGAVNIPPQSIDFGMNEIQPGVHYTMLSGFYGRAIYPHAIEDSAPFLFWLTHGTKFPAKAHREWIEKFFMGNQLVEGTYCMPSMNPDLDGKPVDMDALRRGGVRIFDYRGSRDPIAPAGSCVASQLWGMHADGNLQVTRGGMNRTIEKNIGHIFVVSKQLLSEYLQIVSDFLRGGDCENKD
jgi:poly(3-hydroxyalkanoate) synthetase